MTRSLKKIGSFWFWGLNENPMLCVFPDKPHSLSSSDWRAWEPNKCMLVCRNGTCTLKSSSHFFEVSCFVSNAVQFFFLSLKFPSWAHSRRERFKSSSVHFRGYPSQWTYRQWKIMNWNLQLLAPRLTGFLLGGNRKEKRNKLPEVFICHLSLGLETILGTNIHQVWDPGLAQRTGS